MSGSLPICISMGEPAGIGPEICVKAWAKLGGRVRGRALRLIGSRDAFHAAAKTLGIAPSFDNAILDPGAPVHAKPGRPDPRDAPAITGAIEAGVKEALSTRSAALVTAPIQKASLTKAGFGFPGHTEYLAHLTGAERAVMMLASHAISPPLRVVPFTIHMALAEMFEHLNPQSISETAEIALDGLKKDFGCARPRLAVAGINPHAGEDGTMGTEDRDILAPVIAHLRAEGHEVNGPLSADSLFHDEARKTYDAVLCMYHDQALIPIKTLAFWTGVNITLGLPIIRTSPDHGTALGIAGTGKANESSMIAAIEMAADIAERRGL